MKNESRVNRRTFNEIADLVLGEVLAEVMQIYNAHSGREAIYQQLGKPVEQEFVKQRREGMLDAAGLIAIARDCAKSRVF